MTLAEKAALTIGRDLWATQPIERLGIPSIWLADGPHGVRKAPKSDELGMGDSLPATCFPTAGALADEVTARMVEGFVLDMPLMKLATRGVLPCETAGQLAAANA